MGTTRERERVVETENQQVPGAGQVQVFRRGASKRSVGSVGWGGCSMGRTLAEARPKTRRGKTDGRKAGERGQHTLSLAVLNGVLNREIKAQ